MANIAQKSQIKCGHFLSKDAGLVAVVDGEYGPNITKRMWIKFGKDVAQSTKANVGVNHL